MERLPGTVASVSVPKGRRSEELTLHRLVLSCMRDATSGTWVQSDGIWIRASDEGTAGI